MKCSVTCWSAASGGGFGDLCTVALPLTEHTLCGLYVAVVIVVTVQTARSQQHAPKDDKLDSSVWTSDSM